MTDALDGYRLEEQIGHLLRRAHQRATAIFQTRMTDPQITPTQFAAMVRLLEEGELSQNHLGRLTAMDPATAQGVIRRLAQRELIRQRSDPNDKRRRLLSLTEQGRRQIEQLIAIGPVISAATLEPLNPAEQALLLDLLKRLA